MASPTAGSAAFSPSLFSICWCGAAPGLNPPTSLRSRSSRSLSPLLLSLSFFPIFNSAPDGFNGGRASCPGSCRRGVGSFRAITCCDSVLLSFLGLRAPTASTACGVAFPDVVLRRALWRLLATASVAYCCRRIGRAPLPSAAPGCLTATMPLVACCAWHSRGFLEFGNTAPLAGSPHRAATTVRLGPWPHPLRPSESRYALGSDHGLLACDA